MTKAIILLNGLIAGWDFRTAVVHYSNGEMMWAAVMLVAGLAVLLVAFFLLVLTDI